jgi:hypothetical protein
MGVGFGFSFGKGLELESPKIIGSLYDCSNTTYIMCVGEHL